MKNLFTASLLLAVQGLWAQPLSYEDEKGVRHLCGPIIVEHLTEDTLYSGWYQESVEENIALSTRPDWAGGLEDLKVEVFLGTWCGDSKDWVPKFIDTWEQLGLDIEQLELFALYNGQEKYKQGPNGEEQDRNIHRVPTFIFSRNGQEVARMVEFPRNDLLTDLGQIALGLPSEPNYPAANYLMQQIDSLGIEAIWADVQPHVRKSWKLVGKSSELNTLGYVYLRAGRVEEALFVFKLNTIFFPFNPNTWDSYAEGLVEAEESDAALAAYKRALELNPENSEVEAAITRLEGKSSLESESQK
ncbi:MAG: hypothetical protein AAF804_06920 [Bacteroidota bacterium]